MLMSNELKIERIKSALIKYRWNKADVFKRDEQSESFGPFGMLLRDAGVSVQEFTKENSQGHVYSLVRKHHKLLLSEYGLKDVTDLQLITTAGDCSTSAEDMVRKVTEALSGNLTVFPPGLHHFIKSVVRRRDEFGSLENLETTDFTQLNSSVFSRSISIDSSSAPSRLARVQATLTWNAILQHRVYSCPDTRAYDFVSGATHLVLKNKTNGRRIPFKVESVKSLDPFAQDFLSAIPAKFRRRLSEYKEAVRNITGILDGQCSYRFYFLSTEPWPDWMQQMTITVLETEWSAILSTCIEPNRFFEWPKNVSLLWPGCVRTKEDGQHQYPASIKNYLDKLSIEADTRTNGPAIAAFLAAGGTRHSWGGEGWHIHHIYDRTGAIAGIPTEVPHAVHDGNYFTQSAGLVAAHPVAHHLAHQSDLLKWLLRREAFVRFGFDPMAVFFDA